MFLASSRLSNVYHGAEMGNLVGTPEEWAFLDFFESPGAVNSMEKSGSSMTEAPLSWFVVYGL